MGDLPIAIGVDMGMAAGAGMNARPSVKMGMKAGSRMYLSFQDNNARGNYRVSNDALKLYELYIGQDTLPDFDAAPAKTSGTLPFDSDALAASHTYNAVTRYRNEFNLVTLNILEANTPARGGEASNSFEIGAGFAEVAARPRDPVNVSLTPAAAGEVHLTAEYQNAEDGDTLKATQFIIYLTSGGGNPDPSVDAIHATVEMVTVEGITRLDYTSSSTFGDGVTVKVIVRTRRIDAGPTNIDSQNTTIHETTTDTDGPDAPDPARAHFRDTAEQG